MKIFFCPIQHLAVCVFADNIIFGWPNEISKIAETNKIKNKRLQASGKVYSVDCG